LTRDGTETQKTSQGEKKEKKKKKEKRRKKRKQKCLNEESNWLETPPNAAAPP